MGILSWWRGSGGETTTNNQSPPPKPPSKPAPAETPGMNGAVEVLRAPAPARERITVFEFGSVAASADKVTLVGYCPVSDDLEPCRWEILPAATVDSPQFRVAF